MAEIDIPECYCGELARLRHSWSEANPGRRYFCCRKYAVRERDYGFFRWYDPELDSKRRREIERVMKKIRDGEKLSEPSCGRCYMLFWSVIWFMLGYIVGSLN